MRIPVPSQAPVLSYSSILDLTAIAVTSLWRSRAELDSLTPGILYITPPQQDFSPAEHHRPISENLFRYTLLLNNTPSALCETPPIMESTPTRRGSIVYASPSSELQVSSKNISPGGVSETVCPSNGIHSRRASQQDPFALDHTQTAAVPNALDPEEHGPCIRMLQDAQVASEDLAMRVKVAEQDKETLIRKIKSLVDDVSRLRLQAAVSDKQALQDRIEGLMRQIGYLMNLPKNEEYLSQIKFFEAEARGFRQAKFDTEQLHAQTVIHLQTDNEVLTRKIEVTKHCYSTELTRVSELLECQREMTKRAVQDYELVKAKNSKLETELDEERSKVSELHMYFNQQQERGHAANDAFSQNIRSMARKFEDLTESARVHGQHLGIVDRALQGWLGNSVDEPPPEPRRH